MCVYIYIYIYLGGGGINWLTLSKKKKWNVCQYLVYGILILVTFNESTKILISVK